MTNFNISMNIPAVIVSAVVTFLLAGLWYSPMLFAKPWVAGHGFTQERVERMRQGAIRAYSVSFLCWLVMAAVLSILVDRVGVHTIIGGVKLAGLCWLGFAVTVGMSSHIFSERKISVFLIDSGYQLLSMVVMGLILGAWQA